MRKQRSDSGKTSVRDAEMRRLFLAGETMQQVADRFGVSKQRTQQILFRRFGLRRDSGGAAVRVRVSTIKAARMDDRCRTKFGISIDERRRLLKQYGAWPFHAFSEHKTNSKKRGIPFEFNFSQWWNVWQKSGKWDERGPTGYVMSRPGDRGPYSIENVVIVTASKNHSECRERQLGGRSEKHLVNPACA